MEESRQEKRKSAGDATTKALSVCGIKLAFCSGWGLCDWAGLGFRQRRFSQAFDRPIQYSPVSVVSPRSRQKEQNGIYDETGRHAKRAIRDSTMNECGIGYIPVWWHPLALPTKPPSRCARSFHQSELHPQIQRAYEDRATKNTCLAR